MILKKVSYTHQDCTHLIKTSIAKYYYKLKKKFSILNLMYSFDGKA